MSIVNVIVPCYNGEKYLDRFLLSLLKQTFMDFDIFFIDDGSTDKTKLIVDKYMSLFKEKGIKLNYFYKKNGGAASAINVAFRQKLDGKYLLITDSDDELTVDHIELKVNYLNKHQKYGAVGSYYKFIDNETLNVKCIFKNKGIRNNKKRTFKNILLAKGVVYPGYMFNKDFLFSVLKNNQIFESYGGQNWQLLLPFAYKFKIGIINKFLYKYYIIRTSHSHIGDKKEENLLKRISLHEEILINTLDRMEAKKKFYKYIRKYILERKINIAYKFKNKELMRSSFKEYMKNNFFNIKLFIKFILIEMGLVKKDGKN